MAALGLGVAQWRASNQNAREAGARDERERQQRERVDRLESHHGERMDKLDARLETVATAANATDRGLALLLQKMESMSCDMSDVKTTVGGLAKEMEHTFRNIITGRYDRRQRDESKSS